MLHHLIYATSLAFTGSELFSTLALTAPMRCQHSYRRTRYPAHHGRRWHSQHTRAQRRKAQHKTRHR